MSDTISKKSNPLNIRPISSLHARPVLSSSYSSIKLPIYKKNIISSDTITNSQIENFFGTTSSEPLILLSTNFIPIYDGGKLNESGESLYLREISRVINFKVSALVLSGCAGSFDITSSTQKNVYSFFDNLYGKISPYGFAQPYLENLNNMLDSLTISNSKIKNILIDEYGYFPWKVNNFSESKIYNQGLIGAKRTISTFSPTMLVNPLTRNSSKKIILDTNKTKLDLHTDDLNFWINPNTNICTLNDILNNQKINQNIETINNYYDKRFINLSDDSEFSSHFLTNLDTSLSVLGTILVRESNFSYCLLNSDKDSNLSSFGKNIFLNSYGYNIKTSGGNLKIWDYLFGKFPNDSFDRANLQDENKNSLFTLSQEIISSSNPSYQIQTFENTLEESNNIFGKDYYTNLTLDNSLQEFDKFKLESLVNKIEKARDTIDIIGKFHGIQQNNDLFEFNKDLNLDFYKIISRLKSVSYIYTRIIDPGDETRQPFINPWSSTDISKNLRFESMICKLAVYPTQNYAFVSNRIKTLLFLWMISLIATGSVSEVYKNLLCEAITEVDSNLNAANYKEAKNSFRIIFESSASLNSSSARNSLITSLKNLFITNSGSLFSSIMKILEEVWSKLKIYDQNVTSYSNISKETYLFNIFDLLLRIVADQTPENIIGKFYISDGKFSSTGLITDTLTKNTLNDYFDTSLIRKIKSNEEFDEEKISIKLNKSVEHYYSNEIFTQKNIFIIKNFLDNLNKNINNFLNFIKSSTASKWLNSIEEIYSNISNDEKKFLIEQSVLKHQITSYLWREEILTNDSSKNLTKIKIHPVFSDIPDWASNFTPINQTNLISFFSLSNFFNEENFGSEKANNLKLFTVGLPTGLIQKIKSKSKYKNQIANIIRIKFFKLNRLYPDIVYKPQEFLFETNRFSGKLPSIWPSELLLGKIKDPLLIPGYLVDHNGNVQNYNFSTAFSSNDYNLNEKFESLNSESRKQIYKNHSLSFLLEEYFRWFMGIDLDETCWYNFEQLSTSLPVLEESYENLSNNLKKGSRFEVNNNKIIDTNKQLIEPDNTIKMFLRNETLFLKGESIIKKILYPRKFDRIFSIPIDPDNFIVDSDASESETLSLLLKNGVLKLDYTTYNQGIEEPVYTHRDTSRYDISMDEYFVTIEPF